MVEKYVSDLEVLSCFSASPLVIAGSFNVCLDQSNPSRTAALLHTLTAFTC